MCEASGRSYNGGERSVLAGLGRSRTCCCCFCRSMLKSLTHDTRLVILVPFALHISSSGGVATGKAATIVHHVDYSSTRVNRQARTPITTFGFDVETPCADSQLLFYLNCSVLFFLFLSAR